MWLMFIVMMLIKILMLYGNNWLLFWDIKFCNKELNIVGLIFVCEVWIGC